MLMALQTASASPLVTTNVSLDNIYYAYIEKLDGMGYLKSMPTGAKPYSRLEMAKWTIEAREAAKHKKTPKYLMEYIEALEEGLAAEIAALNGQGKLETVKLRNIDMQFGYRDTKHSLYNYNNRVGAHWQSLNKNNNGYRYGEKGNAIFMAELSGQIAPDLALALVPRFSYDNDRNGKAYLDTGYLKTRIGNVGIEVGKQPIFWGYGHTGSLILGNNTTPLTMIKLNLIEAHQSKGFFKFLGKVNFSLFYSRLEGNRSDLAVANNYGTDFDHPSFAGLRVDITPTRNLTLSTSRVSMLGGKNHGLDSSDWKDWFVGKNAEEQGLDRWNDIAGFDFKYRFPGVHIYGEWYGEDQAGYFPSRTAGRLGFYLPQLDKNGTWDLTLEYAQTKSGWYDHWTFRNGWTYKDNILGDPMGADARKFYLRLQHYLNKAEKISLHAMQTNLSRSLPNSLKSYEIWLTYERKLNNNFYFDTTAGFAKVTNANYDFDNNKDYFVSIGFHWLY